MEKQKFLPFYLSCLQDSRTAVSAMDLSEREGAEGTETVFFGDAFARDWEEALMRSYYPLHIQRMQAAVEGVCDELDYEGSVIYDEYPDPYLLARAGEKVLEVWEREDPKEAGLFSEVETSEHRYRPQGGRRRRRLLEDLARVLLYHEISRRRCKKGSCRRYR